MALLLIGPDVFRLLPFCLCNPWRVYLRRFDGMMIQTKTAAIVEVIFPAHPVWNVMVPMPSARL